MKSVIGSLLVTALMTTSAAADEARHAEGGVTQYCITSITEPLQSIVDINDRGHVLGHGPAGTMVLWNGRRRYEIIDGLIPEQNPFGFRYGMNNRDQIFGTQSTDPAGSILRAFVWGRARNLRLLEPLRGDGHSDARDINDRGEAVGTSGPFPDEAATGFRAVIWDRHLKPHRIDGLPGSTDDIPVYIGDAGQVVGASWGIVGGVSCRAWLWDRINGTRELEGAACPIAANDRLELVGTNSFDGSHQHAFYWSENSGMVDLGDLPDGTSDLSHARDINNHGQIVGNGVGEGGTQAVVWDSNRQIHRLNDLIVRVQPDDQFLWLFSAELINDAGLIAVHGFDTRDRRGRLVLLKPSRNSSPGSHQHACGR